MRACIFSDIHGNGPAFRIGTTMMLAESADVNIFLGDLCGYYYDQLEILDTLLQIPDLVAIRGNHDALFLEIAQGNHELRIAYAEKYGTSMENLLGQDCSELVRWLSDLSPSLQYDRAVECHHGSPWDPLEGYVYPDAPLNRFLQYEATLFLLGHTHYPMVRTIEGKMIVNPGSIGQPRNGGWPTYAVVDFAERTARLKTVPYGSAELIRQIDERDEKNRYLKDVLTRTRGSHEE